MCDELVKRLRRYSENCVAYKLDADFADAVRQAADAIEFLQTYKVALENIVSMGGWWLVGQDKNLYRMDVPINWPPKGTKTVELFPLPEPPKENGYKFCPHCGATMVMEDEQYDFGFEEGEDNA